MKPATRGYVRTLETALTVSVALSLGARTPLYAQCPDGTPPPCAGARLPPLNPNRIAILPFRVTGSAADTLLGQGMAELLAPEFTGEDGPLAINVPTVLRVWRRAGGSLRTPLDAAQAQHVAREIGAGRVVDGSIVGLGPVITITASVTQLPGGAVRRVGPLSAPADSIQSLVGRVASGLLGATGKVPVGLEIRLTSSPSAMRAYLEGMARYRTGDFGNAAAAFERAFALDTLFARAAFMRMTTTQWGVVSDRDWGAITRGVRDRLSTQDQILLGSGTAGRSPAQLLDDHRRIASLLPQSAEAQFVLGDYLYHSGTASGITDDFESARRQLEMAYEMDPQFEELLHLVEIGLYDHDTTLLRRYWGAWQRLNPPDLYTIGFGRVVARILRDSVLQARYDSREPNPGFLFNAASLGQFPARDIEAAFGPSASLIPGGGPLADSARALGFSWLRLAGINTGRLDWVPDSALLASRLASNRWRVMAAALTSIGDSALGRASARVAGTDDREGADSVIDRATLGLLTALQARQPNLAQQTAALDSLYRWRLANYKDGAQWTPAALVLCAAWQALGDPVRALAAVELDSWGLTSPLLLAPRFRQEGRLAAIIGDTARAIRAYQRYLRLRRDADPVLIPERDSVQAALARLQHH